MSGRVRRPVKLKGVFWIATSVGPADVKAYRLIPAESFDGDPTTYNEKIAADGGDFARDDPKGFHHGMKVTFRGKSYVLCGPPLMLTPGEEEPQSQQGFLFDL